MATRRASPASTTSTGVKLRQTQAEYTAARPNAEPGVKPMMSSSKMYVCIRCHANFKTGDGKPDPRLRGLGRCNTCLGVAAPTAAT
jgi:cytochrome c553